MKKERCEKENKFGLCPYVTAQQLLQGKWAILILHELQNTSRRFGELQRSIDVTQATLSSQLKKMEQEGLVNRKIYPEIPPRVEYSLTDIGREFISVLASIEQWGNKYIDFLHSQRNSGS